MIIPEIDQKDYHFDLPDEKIAKYPLDNRSDSKLLVVSREKNSINHNKFNNILDYLENTHVVFNKTKVINARILAQKETGGKAEIFCLNPIHPSPDPQICLIAKSSCIWECMIGGKNIKEGSILFDIEKKVKVEVLKKQKNQAKCRFSWDSNHNFIELISDIGKIPIPPYLNRDSEKSDEKNYQTVYAKSEGSVAAPTAGLHFTDQILEDLVKIAKISELTLHVGAGTFQPLQSDDLKKHVMHQELVNIDKSTIIDLIESLKNQRKIVSVGTTSTRSLESLALFGERLLDGISKDSFSVDQWDGYYTAKDPIESLEAVISWMNTKELDYIQGETQMMIIPGYKFRLVDKLITNFHQPSSSLIMLVGAFLGKDLWRKSYESALENNYRFLSYGDSSILL